MPKFFIPLGFRYGQKTADVYSHAGIVYGPYDDDQAVAQALQRNWPNEKEEQFLVFEGQVIKVPALPKEKPESEKRAPGDFQNYIKSDTGYTCKDCGATIMGARIAHPVWLEGFGCAGTGECDYETVPYCPNCEHEPNFHGSPVTVPV